MNEPAGWWIQRCGLWGFDGGCHRAKEAPQSSASLSADIPLGRAWFGAYNIEDAVDETHTAAVAISG